MTIYKTTIAVAAALLSAATPAFAADMDDAVWTLFELEQLEHRWAEDGDGVLAWDSQFRIGTDENKVAVKSEGEYEFEEDAFEKVEAQVLYQRMISDFFDLQAGIRHDFDPDPSRTYAVLGANGLAPQWFEVDTNLFLSEEGDLSGRLEAEYDILLTQKLILQPAAEVDIAFSDDPDLDVASGFTSLEAGLRLRYEVAREFAPYLGVHWERMLGETADRVRDEGEETEGFFLVGGVRAFF